MNTRFVVGIDLGTTNCALAYADAGSGESIGAQVFSIPQVVGAGAVEPRTLLPSFIYLPGSGEQPAGALKLPWDAERDYCVGEFARAFGAKVPTRLVASAKSWLCHVSVDRKAPILPFRAGEQDRRISPMESSVRLLKHLAEAWNQSMAAANPDHRLEVQEIVLTVPASFDAAARDLTIEAARAAGLENITLLEEPQAAFYAWIDGQGERWREQVEAGDQVLVADVGGGTTDFTLIEIGEENGNLALTRAAVGDHLLLGGDNMDLALAHTIAAEAAKNGAKLDPGQIQQLTFAVRQAKEELLADAKKGAAPVTILGKGRSVIGGSLKFDLTRESLDRVALDGFLPQCTRDVIPQRSRAAGFQELGLPYVADAAITKHLAQFLARQAEARKSSEKPAKKKKTELPSAVLFNGGVFKSPLLRERLLAVMNSWGDGSVRALAGADLDLAVARGAAYYGLVRRGKGVRIRGGTARSYYVGVETSQPAIPGLPPPLKALCVVPFGMEEGTETNLPEQEFGLVVGEEVEFRFLGSTVRRDDQPGTIVDDWEGQIDELTPIRTTLEGKSDTGQAIPVHLHARVTEVGQLELSCRSRDGKKKWKLDFNVREKAE